MAFTEISGDKKYFKYMDLSKGDHLVTGIYLRESVSKRYGTTQFEVEDEKTSQIAVLNGSADLKAKMQQVKPGMLVRIIYNGMIVLERGPNAGAEAHQFSVAVDRSAGIKKLDDEPKAKSEDSEDLAMDDEDEDSDLEGWGD
jgi:hypothetical protein